MRCSIASLHLSRILLAVCLIAATAACGSPSDTPPGEDAGVPRPDGGCTSNSECSDDVFCNGVERCMDGMCLPSSAPACAGTDRCNEAAETCGGTCVDADGDGACAEDDCDDANPNRFPGALERCDTVDQDCDPATLGPDGDGDGSSAIDCCNPQSSGTPLCGTDCDDTRATINNTAVESCNMVDDDCDGRVDEGVCIACPVGYSGTDDMCTDNDECAMGQCGVGVASCANMPGTYACTCATGFTAPATAGTCTDVNECTAGAPCGVLATGCINTIGSYACSCLPGYGAPSTGGTCADLDECALSTCGAPGVVTGCVNSVGSYACTCAAGYIAPASGAPCADINECALGTPCGAGRGTCANNAGGYVCTCESGYRGDASGGTCEDVDECALPRTDDCDRDPAATCANTTGGFACTCPAGFTPSLPAGDARGASGCLLADASLSALVPSVGALSPALASATTMYTVEVPPGETSVTLRPSVANPARASITVDGVTVASGAASATFLLGFAPRPVLVVVTSETGATREYTVALLRGGAAYLKASNTGATDRFGTSVSLSADGTRLAVGAYDEDSGDRGIGGDQTNNIANSSGAVYVFARTGATWTQEAYVKASNTGANDSFGISVSLSSDGTRLAVGASGEGSSATGIGGNQADNAASVSGAVYVFARTATTWTQEAYIKASNTGSNDTFGFPVSLSADGTRLAVGAYREGSSATGIGGNQADNTAPQSGAVYVFARTGTTWTQEAYVKASNTGSGDGFGTRVSLSADGTRLAVGAPGEASSATGIGGNQADNGAVGSGAVYVFSRTGTTWTQEAYVKASNTGANDSFGISVSLSADGRWLAVGANQEASNATGIGGNQANNMAARSGAVYVFSRTGMTWTQEAYVKASNTDAEDFFGSSVSLSADGSRLAVGAGGEDSSATGIGGNQADNIATDGGAVYVY